MVEGVLVAQPVRRALATEVSEVGRALRLVCAQVAGKGRKRKLSKKELKATQAAQRAAGAEVPAQQSKVFKWKRERKK